MEKLLMDDEEDYDNQRSKQKIQVDEDEPVQGEYEINSHYRRRKECYNKAREQGFDKAKSLVISNVFQNYYYLGCVYKKEVMDMVFQCWPDSVSMS